MTAIRYERDADGVALLTLDEPGSSVSTMGAEFARSLAEVVGRLYDERDRLAGVVLTSGNGTFLGGRDLVPISAATPADAPGVFAQVEQVKADLRRLETIGLPVVAALSGSALGAGLEIALACHHRIAVDDPASELGFPDVTLGLLPGCGGLTRTVRMLGIAAAVTDILLKGQRRSPAAAKEAGLVDALVDARDDLLPAARRWVLDHRDDPEAATQRWDRAGYRIPGGTPATAQLAAVLPAFPATLRKQLEGAPYPAPRAILAAAVEGSQVDFDTASRIESRYFTRLVTGAVSTNLIQAFLDRQTIDQGLERPAGVETFTTYRVGVVGAEMLGAGIAYAFARAGVDVVLEDVEAAAAVLGRSRAQQIAAKGVRRGSLTEQAAHELVRRIATTADRADLAGCDVVVEAVLEDRPLKQRVLAEVEAVVGDDVLLCSTTSTLPIGELSQGVGRSGDVVGMHFCSPVERMPLVEIVVGAQTSERALAHAYDVVRQLGKTPIVVNDHRGLFTSRVFGTLVMEAAAMLGEGVSPVTIERAATQAGFPTPPLALLDEVTLTLPQRFRDAAAAAGVPGDAGAFYDHPGMAVVDVLVGDFDRRGRASGGGFYDYPDDAEKALWPGLWDRFVPAGDAEPLSAEGFRELQDRLTFIVSLETVRCLQEGVLRSTAGANVGSILGIGFPSLLGGAVQHVNGYAGGPSAFLQRARALAATYGERFAPPDLLVEKARTGERL